MAQVSTIATGYADRFWDMERSEAIEGLALASHRRTADGARHSVMPVSHSDMVHLWNMSRPKKGGRSG